MRSQLLNWGLPALFGIVVICLGFCLLDSIQHALVIGGDESFELTKAQLLQNKHGLYTEVWNDQPPLFTVILAASFAIYSPNVALARAISVACTAMLMVALFYLVKQSSGSTTAWLTLIILIGQPQFIQLACSCMLEIPALCFAYLSILLLSTAFGRHYKRPLIAASAALFATSLQIKLISAALLPAVVAILILRPSEIVQCTTRQFPALDIMIWLGVAFCVFVWIGSVNNVDYATAYISHFSNNTRLLSSSSNYSFSIASLSFRDELYVVAIVSSIFAWLASDARRLAMPLIANITLTVVFLLHRPYWSYYDIHLAIPCTWLAADWIATLLGLNAFSRCIMQFIPAAGRAWTMFRVTGGILAIWAGIAWSQRVSASVCELQSRARIETDPVVDRLKQFASKTRWIYTKETIYAFHARLLPIPELAVLPIKRFWSGQIDETSVWQIVERYRPEQVLIRDRVPDCALRFLGDNYEVVYNDGDFQLFVLKDVIRRAMRVKRRPRLDAMAHAGADCG